MRITFLTRSLVNDGAERQLVVLANSLKERGHKVNIVVFYPITSLKNELCKNKIPIYVVGKKGRWDIIRFSLKLMKILKQTDSDIINSYIGTPNIFLILLKPFIKKSALVWGIRDSRSTADIVDFVTKILFSISRALSFKADGIIANSYAGKDSYVNMGFSKQNFVVIQNGIDTKRFEPNNALGIRMRNDWGIDEKAKIIGIIGRINEVKDHYTFLKAAKIYLNKYGNAFFVCVGRGEKGYLQKLQDFTHEMDLQRKVRWLGNYPNIEAVYNALDILTSSSCTEGFSNVIGEAMACGIPCVVTDVGDARHLVGNLGIIVPPKSPEALAAGWNEIDVSEKNKSLVRKRIIENFTTKALTVRTENVYEQFIKNKYDNNN